MCLSVARKVQCSRGQECNYAHSAEEITKENVQCDVQEKPTQEKSAPLPVVRATLSNHTAPEVADSCKDSNSHVATHTIHDKMDMTNESNKEEVNDDAWTHVTSPNSCKPSVHTPHPTRLPNPYELLDDGSLEAITTAAHIVSAETEMNEQIPPPSIAAIVSPSSKFTKGLVPPPATHLHIVKAVKGSKSGGQSFQCVKCHGTFQGERFRCVVDITTIGCSWVLCPTCQKAKLKEQVSNVPSSKSAHIAPTPGGKDTFALEKSPAKNIIISEVQYVSTPTSTALIAEGKRNASPHVDDPVEKCLRDAVVPHEVHSHIRNGVATVPENSQTHLQTPIVDLEKTQF